MSKINIQRDGCNRESQLGNAQPYGHMARSLNNEVITLNNYPLSDNREG